MGTIRNVETGEVKLLARRALLGRSSSCDIRLYDGKSSSEHALLRWVDCRWLVFDLGSRNGTWLNGHRLDPGQSAGLAAGAHLSFGSLCETWCLETAVEPVPFVRGDDCEVPIGVDPIVLPGGDHFQLRVSRQDDGCWVAEYRGEERIVEDRECIDVDGRWRLFLPDEGPELMSEVESNSVDVLAIRHDCTEECVQVRLWPRSGPMLDLSARAHHRVLLELARERLDDRERGFSPEQEGWVHRDELSARLNSDEKHVNVMIHRLRRQLAGLGHLDFMDVIERQVGVGMLRLGVYRVKVGVASW